MFDVSTWEAALPTTQLLSLLVLAAATGTTVGAALELLTRKVTGKTSEERTRMQCAAAAALQLGLNGLLLLCALKSSKLFTPWMQVTLSGFMFSVLLFVAQGSLGDNARCALSF